MRATQLQGVYEQQNQDASNAHAYQARIAIERYCRTLAPRERYQCVREAVETRRQAQHDDQDLEAQMVTSVWTHYMGLAAIGGTAFGIIGIFLVLATFRENKRAADAAHDANRPWIEVAVDEIMLVVNVKHSALVTSDVILKNYGNSPATSVLVVSELMARSDVELELKSPIIPLIDKLLDSTDLLATGFGSTIFPNGEDKESVIAACTGEEIQAALRSYGDSVRWLVGYGVIYRFGPRVCRTVKTYEVSLSIDEINYKVEDTPHRIRCRATKLIDTLHGYAR